MLDHPQRHRDSSMSKALPGAMTRSHDDPCPGAHACGLSGRGAEFLARTPCRAVRKGRCHGAQRASAARPCVPRRGWRAHPCAADAQTSAMTRPARGRTEDAEPPHPGSAETSPFADSRNPGAEAMTRQSDRESGGHRAAPSRIAVATDAARWNEQMNRILHEAAEFRDGLGQARSAEDGRLARREAAACAALISARGSWPGQPAASWDRSRSRGASARTEPR